MTTEPLRIGNASGFYGDRPYVDGDPDHRQRLPRRVGLAEWLRSRTVDVPEQLLSNERE